MSLEDDILNNEFSGNESRVIDAEVIFNRPKKSRKLMYSLLLVALLAGIAVGGFLLVNPNVLNAAAPQVQMPKPSVAIPPNDLLGGANKKLAVSLIKPSEPVAAAPKFTSGVIDNPLDVKSNVVAAPLGIKEVSTPNVLTAPPLSGAEFRPEFSPAVKSVEVPVKTLAPVVVVSAVSPERFDALEQKVRDLVGPLEALSKKIDVLVSEKIVKPAKARSSSKSVVSIKSPTVKKVVVSNMKDLHITALLSDGVMFDGDVPVLVGQFSKQFNGRIVSINAEKSLVVTDSKIYKVQ